jgi:hypothetical protein
MAKDSQRLEQEFIATCQEKTGHTLQEWFTIIEQSGETKPNSILNWLKTTHKLNHMQANFLSGIYLNGGNPVFDYEVLFKRLFEGKETLLDTYHAVANTMQGVGDDVELIPTKAYVSVEGKKIFGCVTPTKTNLRVGLDLGDTPFDGYTQKAKSLGAMPNLTHMIEVTHANELNEAFVTQVKKAYKRVHP